MPPGRVPRHKDVILLADLIDRARPGESLVRDSYCCVVLLCYHDQDTIIDSFVIMLKWPSSMNRSGELAVGGSVPN